MKLSVCVLAGGTSSRMGRDKAFLVFKERPLVACVTERVRTCSDDVFVVAKDPERFEAVGLRAVADGTDVQTPLAGIVAALRAAAHPCVFVCACDMPLVSADLVQLIASRIDGVDAAVPLRGGRPEPLHAVWAVSAADRIDAALADGERAVHRVLGMLHVVFVEEDDWAPLDPRGLSFTNINTPAELAQLEVSCADARTAAARSSSDAPRPTAMPSA